MTAIAIEGLTRRYGPTVAVDGVRLDVASGELFFVLGPSGCGKTTLLRLVAGFLQPDAGSIRFGGRDVTRLPPNRRSTGMVFQSYALWPHMSVGDNVAYGLRVRRVPAAERAGRVMAALRAVHMEDLAGRRPAQLSGGEQQRVALARALVVEPQVLLLDEPLSNLDVALRQAMRLEIRRICKDARITTVYVTHDQKEALSMADRVAVLREGRVVQVGAPRDIYARPGSRFVAGFLGDTNLLRATVVAAADGAVTLETPAGRLTSSVAAAPPAGPGAVVTCSIRPESLRPPEELGTRAVNRISARHVETVFLGEMAQHHLVLDDGTPLRVLRLHPPPAPPHHLELAVDPDDVVILLD